MVSKIWVKMALECTFGCPKGAFKQGIVGGRLGLFVIGVFV